MAEYITVRQLRHKFDLERRYDEHFFREWQNDLPALTDLEKQLLDEVKGDYLYLSESIMLEAIDSLNDLYTVLRVLKSMAQLVSQ